MFLFKLVDLFSRSNKLLLMANGFIWFCGFLSEDWDWVSGFLFTFFIYFLSMISLSSILGPSIPFIFFPFIVFLFVNVVFKLEELRLYVLPVPGLLI